MAETVLEVDSVDTALAIFGNCDENIRLLEQAFGVTAICRGTEVKLTGGEEDVERARSISMASNAGRTDGALLHLAGRQRG